MAGDPQAQQAGPDAERLARAARGDLDYKPGAPVTDDGIKTTPNQSPPASGAGAPPDPDGKRADDRRIDDRPIDRQRGEGES
jgi:hypothetical protein